MTDSPLEHSAESAELTQQMLARALQLLAVREHGDRELCYKLKQKYPEVENDLVDAVLLRCQEENWQSDERYIESFVKQALEKGQGPLKIRQTLSQRSSHDDIINCYLAMDDSDWADIAKQALSKKYGEQEGSLSAKEQAKQMRFLASRGFSQSQIWKIFKF